MSMELKAVLSLDNRGFKTGIDGARRELDKMAVAGEDSNKRLAASTKASGDSFGFLKSAIAGAIAAFSVAAIAQGVNGIIQANAEVNLLTQSLEVNRESLQTWQLVGKQAGIDIADMFKDVREKIGEFAATGGGEAVDLFKRLKIDVNDLINRSPDQQLLKIADALSQVKDISAGEKTFLLESLANDASKLLPYLDDNAAKLREIDRIARESGAIITPEQNAVLSEASLNLGNIELAAKGAGTAISTELSRAWNEVAPSATAALSEVSALVTDASASIREDADTIAAAWGYAWEQAAVEQEGFVGIAQAIAAETVAVISDTWDGIIQVIDMVVEAGRIGFTYFPVFAQAAFSAVEAEAVVLAAGVQAAWNDMQAAALNALAAMVEGSGRAFGAMAGVAGNVIGYIIGRLAAMAGAVSAVTATFQGIPGFENVGAGAAAVEARLNSMASAAKNAGADIAASSAAAASAIRASAAQDTQAANIARSRAVASRLAAQSAIADAAAYMQNAEQQRTLNLEMGKAERQFASLGSRLDENGAKLKKARVDQDAVNKALQDGAGAAGKKSAADTAAAKAAKDHAREVERLQKAQDDEIAKLNDTYSKLTMNEQAYYASTLQSKQFAAGVRAEAEALHYRNTVEDERKRLEKEARQTLPETQQYRMELEDKGIKGSELQDLAGKDLQNRVAELTAKVEENRQKALLTAAAYREWELVHREGLTPALAAAQVAMEKEAEQLDKNRKLTDDFAKTINDHAISSLQKLVDTGNELLDKLINKLIEAVMAGQGLGDIFGSVGGFGGGGGGGNWLTSAINSLFGGGRATGGATRAGTINEVNERGIPELIHVGNRTFVMNTADGYVEPLSIGGSTSTTTTGGSTSQQIINQSFALNMPVNIDARGADQGTISDISAQLVAFEQRIYRNVPAIVRQAQINNRMRPTQ